MKINIQGEDGFTLHFLANKFEQIKSDLGLDKIDKIWFRPSFGRSAGSKKLDCECGYSGFGESDALLFGNCITGKKAIVFIESKNANIISSVSSDKELRYQFFLKLCMIYAILHPTNKKMGIKQQENIYNCLELPVSSNVLSGILYNFYKEYKGKVFQERKNGWSILKNSPESPALWVLENLITTNSTDEIAIKFYALGFKGRSNDSKLDVDFFNLSSVQQLPQDIINLFFENGSISVFKRNFIVKGKSFEIVVDENTM
jgi:hypothetical protein